MFKDHKDKISMMRVALAVSLLMGSCLITGGITAVFMQLSGATALVNAGVGLISISGISKVFQARIEHV